VRKLRSLLPREREPFDLFLLEWARFKYRLAEIAAECLAKLLPNAVKEVYYMELSEEGIGRDVDLFIVVDESKVSDAEEVAEVFESILMKLVHLSGLEALKYTTAPTLFEVHVSGRNIYGSASGPRMIRIYPRT
jgi:DNA-binding Lrp family transcriptional regulator